MELTTVVLRNLDRAKAADYVRRWDEILEAARKHELTPQEASAALSEIGAHDSLCLIGYLPPGKTQGPVYDAQGEPVDEVVAGDKLMPLELFRREVATTENI